MYLASKFTSTEMDPPNLKPHAFHKEGGWTAEQLVWPPKWPWEGSGLSAPPHSLPLAVKSASAGDAQEIHFHLFWAWLVGKPQIQEGSLAYQHDRGSLHGGGEGAHSKGRLSQPWEQLPSRGARRLPASQPLSNHLFCSLVANNAFNFIRKTSVLNDRNSWYALKDTHQSQGTWVTKQAGNLDISITDFIHLQLDQNVSSAKTPRQACPQLCYSQQVPGLAAACYPSHSQAPWFVAPSSIIKANNDHVSLSHIASF